MIAYAMEYVKTFVKENSTAVRRVGCPKAAAFQVF
jgi:hypothetical protein